MKSIDDLVGIGTQRQQEDGKTMAPILYDVLQSNPEISLSFLLHQISTAQISNDQDLRELKESFIKEITKILSCAGASIFMIGETGGYMSIEVANGGAGKGEILTYLHSKFKDGKLNGLVRHSAELGKILVSDDQYTHPYFDKSSFYKLGHFVVTSMTCPLMVLGKVIGVVQVFNKVEEPLTVEEKTKAKNIENKTMGVNQEANDWLSIDEGVDMIREVYNKKFTDKDMLSLKMVCDMLGQKINEYLLVKKQEDHNLEKFREIIFLALREKDPYTIEHSDRVQKIASAFALRLKDVYGFSDEELRLFKWAGILHDIGKSKVKQKILLKPDVLTREEYNIMQTHVPSGSELINSLIPHVCEEDKSLVMNIFQKYIAKNIETIENITRHHHERYDGKGYPNGVSGKDIPTLARILTLADVFDAMMSRRPYKKGNSLEFVQETILKMSGSFFDPELVDCFVEMTNEPWISALYKGDEYNHIDYIKEQIPLIYSLLNADTKRRARIVIQKLGLSKIAYSIINRFS